VTQDKTKHGGTTAAAAAQPKATSHLLRRGKGVASPRKRQPAHVLLLQLTNSKTPG